MTVQADIPLYVHELEAAYGAPSNSAFGSAIFFTRVARVADVEPAALEAYRHFVGKLWQQYGEDAWMGAWKRVYLRPAGIKHDVESELRGISEANVRLAVPMILDDIEGAETARAALAQAFDNPLTTVLAVYNIGDGAAMSGIVVTGCRETSGETTMLVFLMD